MHYKLLYGIVWLISLLPLSILYGLSNVIYFLTYYVVKYRRQVVHDNITSSFPDKSVDDIRKIEKKFYAFFSDYIVETIKLCTMSEKEMRRRMEFVGVEEMVTDLERNHKNFAFLYLAHYCNWEWVASMAMWIHEVNPNVAAGQIYHPLKNAYFDQLFLRMRGKFRGDNIAMKETLRYILRKRNQQIPTIIGFIADQGPKWNSIHHWTDFLHHKTPVFTGTEQIAKQVDAMVYYGHMERVKRGYYRCTITQMADDVKSWKDYDLTDAYFKHLASTITAEPSYWLWSHKRWKRTYEEFLERQKQQHIR